MGELVYCGWIIADRGDEEFLKNLGVRLGKYEETTTSFEGCEVSLEVLEKLDPYWGRFYWGLEKCNKS